MPAFFLDRVLKPRDLLNLLKNWDFPQNCESVKVDDKFVLFSSGMTHLC